MKRPRLIVGLIPEALGPMAPDMCPALDERRALIERRAPSVAEEAVRTKAPWTRALGPVPTDRADRARWMTTAITVAAYRDRYGITGARPLCNATTDTEHIDRPRANAAIRRVHYALDLTQHQREHEGLEGIGL